MAAVGDVIATVDGKCSCHGRNLEKLIRPALLIALTRGDLCGYRVVRELGDMPMFGGERPNASGVYRALAAMADEGLVSASWDTSEAGPAKRVYRVTPRGRSCLSVWIDTLSNYRDSIDSLLAAAEAVLGTQTEHSCDCSKECVS